MIALPRFRIFWIGNILDVIEGGHLELWSDNSRVVIDVTLAGHHPDFRATSPLSIETSGLTETIKWDYLGFQRGGRD